MRRVLIATVLAVGLMAVVFAAVAGGQSEDDDGAYRVRAIFDNGGFIVTDENVRIGGANVGNVESVDVSLPGETVSLENGPADIPGKAVVVLEITDPGFQDFREDASCRIRPQSLIGEKFVECTPTQPRRPGTDPPPPLEQIPEGEAGAGQYLLPVENNGTAVDIDLVNNIMRRPYAERFRLILNSLGAALGARGEELNDIVRRANPALRETDEVLRILAGQNRELAQLTTDSDAILTALANDREAVTGFLRSAGETAAATAERGDDLEENLSLLPATLRELRLTMNRLGEFSDASQPVFEVLGGAAPEITATTRQLGPFADATTVSLRSLGDAAEEAGPDLRAADPVVRQLRDLGLAGQRPARELGRLTGSLRETGGFDDLLEYVYNTAGTVNGFDRFGHYQRVNILVSSCIEYSPVPLSGCSANFASTTAGRQGTAAEILKVIGDDYAETGGSLALPEGTEDSTTGIGRFNPVPLPELMPEEEGEEEAGEEEAEEEPAADPGPPVEALDYLLGP